LFGSLLLEFSAHDDWGTRFERGAQRVARVGKARAGDKSMLDALLPAGAAFKDGGFAAAAVAASQGAAATIPMAAQRGRARYIENGGAGQIDPGAVSIALMVEVLREHCA
jgi:phosphoenolpyruvate---glycerone phosphotransferase subunit DhaL